MSRVVHRCGVLICLSALVLLSGCSKGDGLNRKAVSGTITVDGTPIPNGQISFEPLGKGGVSSGAVVSAGKYSIPQDKGLPPGKYLVRINGDDGANFGVSPGKMPGDEIMPPKTVLVPPEWNAKSKNETENEDKRGTIVKDFPIEKKKK